MVMSTVVQVASFLVTSYIAFLAPMLGVDSLRLTILILTLTRLWRAAHYFLAGRAIDKLNAG